MYSYREYHIKCKSCNEQLACYSEEYESLVKEHSSHEKALNILGIMEPCSRYNMMNPTIKLFNKENRQLIEGIKGIEEVDKNYDRFKFQGCNLNVNNEITIEKTIEKISTPVNTSTRTIGATTSFGSKSSTSTSTFTIANKPNVTKKALTYNRRPIRKEIIPESEETDKMSEIEPLTSKEIETTGTNLTKLRLAEVEKEYQYPTIVGVPTINSNNKNNVKIHIEGTYYAEVLSGRTYICR